MYFKPKKFEVDNVTQCWNWILSLDKDGYGVTNLKGKTFKAHRLYYQLFKGQLIKGMVIDHICRNRKCVNPEHLRQVSPRTNVFENSEALAFKNKQKTHCKNGHEYSVENTRITPAKGRVCRTCDRERGSIRKGINRNENRRNKRKLFRNSRETE